MNTKILLSNIIHQRFIPFKHKLQYNAPSLFLNLSELHSITKDNKLFSLNSFNLFSFYESDHGYRDNRSIEKFITENLNKFKIKYKKLDIKILCFPRILGYAFDPLSIFYCFDSDKLISIFYEVKNTSNEQHTYIFNGNEDAKQFKLSHKCQKLFYVSPFIKMEAHYEFINKMIKDKLNINIDPSTVLIKNYGYPISSYGEHYGHPDPKIQYKYEEAPLHKSHKKYGFEEPIDYFVPSIGISDIEKIENKLGIKIK